MPDAPLTEMEAARNAMAGLNIEPAMISRNEDTLEAAFEEIDFLKIEISFLNDRLSILEEMPWVMKILTKLFRKWQLR